MMKNFRDERKVLRKIYRSVFNNTEQKWELRTKAQLYQLYKREDVVQFTRGTLIEWTSHVWRADGSMLKEALTYGEGKETKGKTAEKMERQL